MSFLKLSCHFAIFVTAPQTKDRDSPPMQHKEAKASRDQGSSIENVLAAINASFCTIYKLHLGQFTRSCLAAVAATAVVAAAVPVLGVKALRFSGRLIVICMHHARSAFCPSFQSVTAWAAYSAYLCYALSLGLLILDFLKRLFSY